MRLSLQSLIAADASREQIEDWCRQQAQSYTVPIGSGSFVACRVLGKYLMYGAASDDALTPHLALNGIWEPWITMAIARHVKPGMRCMDIGSCYGYYALVMADIVGESGHVQAWEPIWGPIVARNALVNGLPVDVVPSAMASVDGVIMSPVMPHKDSFFNAGDVRMVPFDQGNNLHRWTRKIVSRTPVPMPYDFIKIDVEGAEDDVWKALAGVRELSPTLTVCMEFTPYKHAAPASFLELLVSDGFRLGTVGHDGTPRECSLEEALVPDTGEFRMLWLTRAQ